MTRSKSIRNTVSVNGTLLRNDRIEAGLSQEALLAACNIRFHIGTLRRAENGENISRTYLEGIADVLKEKADKYINSPRIQAPSSYVCNGDWTGFCVQDHTGSKPYIVEEIVRLVYNDTELSGIVETTYRETAISMVFTALELRGNMLFGDFEVEDWSGNDGFSRLQVSFSRSDEWADGAVSWFDMDWQCIRQSRYIMVKNTSQLFDSYIKDAKSHMEKEILLHQARYGIN